MSITRGATPIPDGEALADEDLTIANDRLAFAIAVESRPPWGVPRGILVDLAAVEEGEVDLNRIAFAELSARRDVPFTPSVEDSPSWGHLTPFPIDLTAGTGKGRILRGTALHLSGDTMTPTRSALVLLGWLALVVLAALTGIATPPGEWYAGLIKPPFTPPNLTFPIAWSLLYLLMVLAAWRATLAAPAGRRWPVLWPFLAQLAANALWSPLFFGLHWMLVALLDLLLLWGLIVLTVRRFAGISRLAAWLLVPYLVWVSFAAYLNAGVWWLNG